MKIAVFGASGNVGKHVLKALASESTPPGTTISAVTRNTDALSKSFTEPLPGIEFVQVHPGCGSSEQVNDVSYTLVQRKTV